MHNSASDVWQMQSSTSDVGVMEFKGHSKSVMIICP